MDSFKNIPYGKQTIETDDINALNEVLNENTYLTTGPRVNKFEEEVCKYIGCKYGLTFSDKSPGKKPSFSPASIAGLTKNILLIKSFSKKSIVYLFRRKNRPNNTFVSLKSKIYIFFFAVIIYFIF